MTTVEQQVESPPVTDTQGFFSIAARDPFRLALIGTDGERVSYGELATRANRISNGLRDQGIGEGDRIAVLAHNQVASFEIILATNQIGVIEVPVNWHLSEREVAYILSDSSAKALIADSEFAAQYPTLRELPGLALYCIGEPVAGWTPYSALQNLSDGHPPRDRTFGQLMGYTSGTTGMPKGVYRPSPGVSPSEGFETLVTFISMFGLGAEGVNMVCSPLYHSAPFGFAQAGLHVGHTLVILEGFDAELVLKTIDDFQVTTAHMVPTHFHRMLSLPESTRARYRLSSLQAIVHAGAPCPVHVKRDMIAWVGPILWEYLGATEGIVALTPPGDFDLKPGTVGRVGANVLIIGEDDEEVPVGEPGTIYFLTSMPYEYLNSPEKTAESRRGNYVTVGDVGYLDNDHYLFTLDRRTDLILSGGVNIYPAEIESHFLEHAAVVDVCVVGVPDEEWGQRVIAVVQPVPGLNADDVIAALSEHARHGLASYKRPRQIELNADLPRNAAGKLQRRLVRELYAPR